MLELMQDSPDLPSTTPATQAAVQGEVPAQVTLVLPSDAPIEVVPSTTTPAAPPPPPPPSEQVQQVLHQLTSPEWWDAAVERAIVVGIVALAAIVVLRMGRRLILGIQRSRNLPDAAVLPIRRFLRVTILILALLIALQLVGVPMTTVWTAVSGLLALIAIGFIAVWSVLSNAMCSFLLMIFKPFRIGDMVEIIDTAAGPNVGGRVTDVTLMFVVLREEAGEGDGGPASLIQVPNNIFFQKTIRRRAGRRAIPLEMHVDKHGLIGREQTPPPSGG